MTNLMKEREVTREKMTNLMNVTSMIGKSFALLSGLTQGTWRWEGLQRRGRHDVSTSSKK